MISRTWWAPLLLAPLMTARLRAQNICTGIVAPGLVVEVRDAATGQGVAGQVSVTARDSGYVDSLRAPNFSAPRDPSFPFQGAYERAGTYEVSIQSPGYVAWRRDGVRIRKNKCHVITVHLVARLTRSK